MKRKELKVGHLYGDKDGVRIFRKAPNCYDGYALAFYEVFYVEKTSSYRAGYVDKDGGVVWRKHLHFLTENEIKYFVEW